MLMTAEAPGALSEPATCVVVQGAGQSEKVLDLDSSVAGSVLLEDQAGSKRAAERAPELEDTKAENEDSSESKRARPNGDGDSVLTVPGGSPQHTSRVNAGDTAALQVPFLFPIKCQLVLMQLL